MPVGQVMPVPAGVSLVEAAGLPEVAATVWSNVFMTAHLSKGERFLVHGGAGGIGTMAIQLAAARGARGVRDRRLAGEARAVPLARAPRTSSTTARTTSSRCCTEAGGADVDPRQHGREVPRPQRRRARHRRPARGHRHAGRRQGRARPLRPAPQARLRHRDLAAGPAGRREGRDLLRRSSRTSGRSSPPARSGRSSRPRCRSRTSPARTQLMEDGGALREDPASTALSTRRAGSHGASEPSRAEPP